MTLPDKEIELSFAHLEFYEEAVVSSIKDEILVEEHHIDELEDACRAYYGEEAFVYLSERKYNYNVNPIVYLKILGRANFKGIGVIAQTPDKLRTANFEKSFSPVPFEMFHNKMEALAWAKSLIQTTNN